MIDDLMGGAIKDGWEKIYSTPEISFTDKVKKEKIITLENFLSRIEPSEKLSKLVYLESKAGSGKTTFLKYLKYLKTKRGPYFDFIIRLRAYATEKIIYKKEFSTLDKFLWESGDKIHVIIKKHTYHDGLKFSYGDIHSALKGRSLIMIDSFDEIIDHKRGDKITESFIDYKKSHVNTTIIFSGRPNSLPNENIGKGWTTTHCKLLPLSQQAIQNMLNGIFNHLHQNHQNEKWQSYELYQRIIRNTSIHELATVPLLLTLIVRLYIEKKEVPEHRDTLLEKFVNNAIERRISINNKAKLEIYKKVLSRIAYSLNSSHNIEDLTKDLHQLIENIKETHGFEEFESFNVVFNYLKKSGLISHDSAEIEFTHRSIQDYLCAYHLFHYEKLPEDINYTFIEEKDPFTNLETLFYYCCICGNATHLFTILTEEPSLNTCIGLYIWKKLGSNLIIDSTAITQFWDKLQYTQPTESLIRTRLQIKLERLKCGQITSEDPITIDEYRFLIGDLPKRHIKNNIVVGIGESALKAFFAQLNHAFGDGRGLYSAVSGRHSLYSNVKDDAFVFKHGHYGLFEEAAINIEKQKSVLDTFLQSCINKLVNRLKSTIDIHNAKRLKIRLKENILNSFNGDTILPKKVEYYNNSTNYFFELKREIFGPFNNVHFELPYNKHRIPNILLGGKGERIIKKYEKIVTFSDMTPEDYTKEDVCIILMESFCNLFNALLYDKHAQNYVDIKHKILKYSLFYMAEKHSEIDLWGSIYVEYTINDHALIDE